MVFGGSGASSSTVFASGAQVCVSLRPADEDRAGEGVPAPTGRGVAGTRVGVRLTLWIRGENEAGGDSRARVGLEGASGGATEGDMEGCQGLVAWTGREATKWATDPEEARGAEYQ